MKTAEVIDLCKEYPGFSLSDVSFSLEAGRITGFIGRNGAGKTTTIRSMLNLAHPSSGSVRYFGKDFLSAEREIRQKIGYAAGGVNYYPKKKLAQIAAITKTFYEEWDEKAYREYLALFGLDENKTPSELSDGMRVKFNLLLALSHRAEVFILDEPTSGLDPFSRDELSEIFTELKNRGAALLFSTHIISELEKCADDIVYIREGRIIATGPMTDFITDFGRNGESPEEIMLRLEREARHA